MNGDVARVLGHLVDLDDTMATSIGLAVTRPNIAGLVAARGALVNVLDLARRIRERIPGGALLPILPLILPWIDTGVNGIVPSAPTLRNTRRKIIVTGSVPTTPPSTARGIFILHTVLRALVALTTLPLSHPRPTQPFKF